MKKFIQSMFAVLSCSALILMLQACGGEGADSGASSGGPKVVTLKMGHALDESHPVHKAMLKMKELADEKSGGTIKIDIYPSEQLGSEKEMLEGLQLGTLDMMKTSTAPMEAFVPKMAVFSLPYIFRDADHRWAVLNGEIGEELLAAGESKGFVGLCYYDSGSRSFYADKPIMTPDDLTGVKVRVMQSKTSMDMVSQLGGSPTPIDWGELYNALQQGVVDGAENNPPSYETSRHYEVVKHYSLDEHTSIPDIVLISTNAWKKLSPEQQKALKDAAEESVPYQRELWDKKVESSMQVVKDAGVEVHYPDKAAFRAKVKPMMATYEGTEIGDLLKRIDEVE